VPTCTRCSTELRPEARYCPACGTPVGTDSGLPADAPPGDPDPDAGFPRTLARSRLPEVNLPLWVSVLFVVIAVAAGSRLPNLVSAWTMDLDRFRLQPSAGLLAALQVVALVLGTIGALGAHTTYTGSEDADDEPVLPALAAGVGLLAVVTLLFELTTTLGHL
jgi:hypothetical protein